MKHFFSFLLLLSAQAHAQQLAQVPVDAITHFVTYSAVVTTPAISQADLLARTRVWANAIAVPAKPPLLVNEQGTDVVVVIGTQVLNTGYFNTSATPQTLYYTATIAVRKGRYQYHLTDFVFETPGTTPPFQPTVVTAETAFLHTDPPKATGASYLAHLRKAFDEATTQITATLQSSLAKSLTAEPRGRDW